MEDSMIARRDLLIGGACVVAAGAGAALKPRHEKRLLTSGKVADLVPSAFDDWTSEEVGDAYAINGKGTLSAKLYNELVVRQYTNLKAGSVVTMLLAYGGRQSDELQLHRPEICYPAFGYNLVRNEPFSLPIGPSASLPVRRLAAQADDRRESIIYWTRMGELLPQDGGQQRMDRLRIAMKGVIPDGLLSRFSMTGDYPEKDWISIAKFIDDLVTAIAPAKRNVLIGTERANSIRGVPSRIKA
jgi:EpsI family protein